MLLILYFLSHEREREIKKKKKEKKTVYERWDPDDILSFNYSLNVSIDYWLKRKLLWHSDLGFSFSWPESEIWTIHHPASSACQI